MPAGRPRLADPSEVYAFAHQFYWDFRRLSEGGTRRKLNEDSFRELTDGLDKIPLIDDADRARHVRIVHEEIEAGRLKPSQRAERLSDIENAELMARRDFYEREAAEEATQQFKIPGETEVVEVLLDPNTTPKQINELCKDAFMTRRITIGKETRDVEVPAWPIPPGSTLPMYLSRYAEQYVAALHDPRFPRCDVSIRRSTRLKQFWFLSRALAGALFGVSVRTAINLVGSLRPEQMFTEARDAKPWRKTKERAGNKRKSRD